MRLLNDEIYAAKKLSQAWSLSGECSDYGRLTLLSFVLSDGDRGG